ncbi:conserved exported hypothetical protein [Candidatus Sulfopaludibacter sp. SbA3]|nr:conserved exported hypothetical protein [Candidatus Sulfopaludibacter sp. SbA3]
MRFAAGLWLASVACFLAYGATPALDVSLAHGTTAELETRQQLERLLKAYDLSDWVWTRKIVIDKDAIPHSHPVLTLHTRHLKEDFLPLSTFVHEEYHWYETAHPGESSAAIAELKTAFPRLPVGGLDGASEEQNSYLHVIVCYAEWQKMKALVGAEKAHEVMEFWAGDHYRAIYRLVLDHEAAVGEVVHRHQLLPQP